MLRWMMMVVVVVYAGACNRCEEACPSASENSLDECRQALTACDLSPVPAELCSEPLLLTFELTCGLGEDPGTTYTPVQGPERSDNRCGPDFGDAVCGEDRCCSTSGWCGNQDQSHCGSDNGFGGAFDGP